MRRSLVKMDTKAKGVVSNCRLYHKELRSYDNQVFGLLVRARQQRKKLEDTVERLEIMKF